MTYSWTVTTWIGDADYADHPTDALTDSLDQYSEKPRFQAFLAALMDQVQSLEDLARELITLRSVYTAVGNQLDDLGKVVVLDRGELTDSAYRIFLLGKIYANTADGKAEQIYSLMERLGIPGVTVHDYWSSAGLVVYGGYVEHPEPTRALLELMIPAGVQWVFEFNTEATDTAFTFSSTINAEGSSTTKGMGQMNSEAETTDGGKLAGTLSGGE